MKIEKVNDYQIRCTLTKADLEDRELKLSELAYGSEKAKSLFQDMMQQASYECGFEADDIPLMIEAIPMNSDCIVLIITKVEDPEELDTRFSKFSPSVHEDEDENLLDKINNFIDEEPETAADVLDLFKRIDNAKAESIEEMKNNLGTDAMPYNPNTKKSHKLTTDGPTVATAPENIVKVFSFDRLDPIIEAAVVLRDFYNGDSILYKNEDTLKYLIVLSRDSHTSEEFNKVCNIISEYALKERSQSASKSYLEEHFEPLIKERALEVLKDL